MSDTAKKKRLYEEFSRVAKALASPDRLEILDLLSQGEKTVDSLTEATSGHLKNISAHLRVLRQAQLVMTRRSGTFIYYRVADDSVMALVRQVQAVARDRLAEVDRAARAYLGDHEELEPLTGKELREWLRNGDVLVLDVRPEDEYLAGHVPGAVSIPLKDLNKRLHELPRDRDVVAYCRGPYCVYAVEAVVLLKRAGYRARRASIGVPEWKLLGQKVET